MVRSLFGAREEDIKMITDNFKERVIPMSTDLKYCGEHGRPIFVEYGLREEDLPDYIDRSWCHYEKPDYEGGYFVMDIVKFWERNSPCAVYVLLTEGHPTYLIGDWSEDGEVVLDIFGRTGRVYEEDEKYKKSYGHGVYGDYTKVEFKNPESKVAKKYIYKDFMFVCYRNGEEKKVDFFDENN